jgi:predicted transglutaminase-like cysteine proteinase
MSSKIYIFSIILCFFNCSHIFAQEAYRTDNLLASKEEESQYFIIRQDKYKAGSVLVSVPNQTDTTILDLLKNSGIRTLEDYARWLAENIKYKTDEAKDTWAQAQETLQRKSGDCEDYAFLNAAVLNVLGYHPKVLGLKGVRASIGRLIGNHAICVFTKDCHYLYFDNEKLKTTYASSIAEFLKYIFTRFNCLSISELWLNDKNQEKKTLNTEYVRF